jgi:hypothetical protein
MGGRRGTGHRGHPLWERGRPVGAVRVVPGGPFRGRWPASLPYPLLSPSRTGTAPPRWIDYQPVARFSRSEHGALFRLLPPVGGFDSLPELCHPGSIALSAPPGGGRELFLTHGPSHTA